jgi:hypothetical protein
MQINFYSIFYKKKLIEKGKNILHLNLLYKKLKLKQVLSKYKGIIDAY